MRHESATQHRTPAARETTDFSDSQSCKDVNAIDVDAIGPLTRKKNREIAHGR
jgi:hypothetical protein